MINTSILLTAMFILISLFLILIVLVPVKQEIDNDSELKEQQEEQEEQEQQEEQEEQDETDSKEYFNADSSSILPIKRSGKMYIDQNKNYEVEQKFLLPEKNEQLHSNYNILFHDSDNLNSRFQIPPPNTSANINAFVDFLGSTYAPINNKYRINSNGPLI